MKNNKGMGLLEVLISLAVMGVVSAALIQLFIGMNQYLKKAENKSSEIQLVSEVNQVVADKDLCIKAISDAGTQKVDLSLPLKLKLKLPASGDLAEGNKLKNSLIVKDFYVDSYSAPVSAAAPNTKRVTGAVWLRTEDDGIASVLRRKKNIGVINLVYDDTSKDITECFGSLVSPKANCESLGLIWNSSNQSCHQSAAQSCADLGGSWNGSKCTITAIDPTLSILNKSCTGANNVLVGFDGAGNPKCQLITVSSGQGPGTTTTVTQVPADAKFCKPGYADIPSPDGKNNCHFEWGSVLANTNTSCSTGMSCSNGGSASAFCNGNGDWSGVAYSCPSKTGSTCVGGHNTITSKDGTNSCFFKWGMGTTGQSIPVEQATSGGTLSGTCNSTGNWTFFYNCPGKQVVTCPSGNYTYNKCNFAWDSTPASSPASNLRDLNGFGSASGFYCTASGTWDNSKGSISGCN